MSKIRIKQIALDANWVANGTAQYQIKNIADPTDAQDAVTKAYVDSFDGNDTYTTGATLVGSTIYFDNQDSLSAYTADLSALDVNDTFVTGGTISYVNEAGTTTFTNNDGGTFDVTGITDVQTTGGTYNNGTGDITFAQNDGSTFDVDLSTLDLNDTFTTGATLVGSTAYFDNQDSLSAYTLDLSTLDINDTFVTGGTVSYTNEDGTITFTNNDGGTFDVSNITDVQTTGSTLVGSTATFTQNDGSTYALDLSALDVNDTFTTGSTLVGDTIYFDNQDGLSAYTTDLSALITSLTLTDGEGTTANGTSVDLGGTITQSTVITDSRAGTTAVGIEYAADYSANFTNNSLITKIYVDGVAAGLDPKGSVVATTTGNIDLSGLTVQGGSDWDTVLTAGDRILVKDQTDATENGIFTASTTTWGRAQDSDGSPANEVTLGNRTLVEGQNGSTGNTEAGTAWVLYSSDAADPKNAIDPGVDTQLWTKYSEQTTLIDGNGTTANGSAVDLGGTLSQPTTLLGAANSLTLGTTGSELSTLESNAATSITLDGAGSSVTLSNNLASLLVGTDGLSVTTGTTTFTDSSGTPTGIEYAADYSATFVDNSLITKLYVDNAITGATAADTFTTGSTLIGSTVYFDNQDSLSAYTLDLSGLDVNDTFVTGGTMAYVNESGTATFTNNDGGTFDVTGINDIQTTGGTYDNGTGDITFTNNDASTYVVDLSTLDLNDTYTTGSTTIGNTIYFDTTDGLSAYTADITAAVTESKGAESEGAAISGFTGGTGVLASDPFGTDVVDVDVTPAVFLNGVKYKVGDGTTVGKDCWFAAAGTPGTAVAFSALDNTLILVWSAANSTIDIDTGDYVWVTYGKVV